MSILGNMLGRGAVALGWDAGESSRMRRDLGWGRRTARDESGMMQDGTLENIRLRTYDLRRNIGIVAGVCDRLALWVCGSNGIVPQAITSSDEWNREAEDFWSDWSARCDSRGVENLAGLQSLACSMRPTHGGIYLETLSDGTVRPIESERIRQPRKKQDQANTYEGVKVDPSTGKRKAYRVHSRGTDGGFGSQSTERWVQASEMLPVVRPSWRLDQVREIPDLAPVVTSLVDLGEMNKYVLNTAKAHAQVTFWLQKLQGAQGVNSLPRGSTPAVGSRQTFKTDWGQVLELFAGESIQSFDSKTPNGLHIPYMQFQHQIIAPCLGFPYEFFTLDFSKCDYSRMKGVLLLINVASRPWKSWLIDSMLQRLWNWRIAMAMDQGEISRAPTQRNRNGLEVSEWANVAWQPPEEPWVDRQEAQQSDVLEYQLGIPLAPAHKRRGGNFEDNLRAKAREIKLADRIAAEEGVAADRLIQTQIPGQAPPASTLPDTEDDESKGADKK